MIDCLDEEDDDRTKTWKDESNLVELEAKLKENVELRKTESPDKPIESDRELDVDAEAKDFTTTASSV